MSSIEIVFTLPFLLKLASASARPPADIEAPRTYEVLGVIEDLKPDAAEAIVHHREIPGFLAATAATLRARDTREFEGLKPGDDVAFRIHLTGDDGWIDELRALDESGASSRRPQPQGLP